MISKHKNRGTGFLQKQPPCDLPLTSISFFRLQKCFVKQLFKRALLTINPLLLLVVRLDKDFVIQPLHRLSQDIGGIAPKLDGQGSIALIKEVLELLIIFVERRGRLDQQVI